MNYDQAKELSFLVPWKTSECFSGKECWCRIIVPVEPILYSHNESPDVEHEYVIVDAGALDEETAEYMVKLHNEQYEKIKQSCRDAVKEMTETLVPFHPNESVTLTSNPTIEDFIRKPIRKIERKEID